MLQGVVLTAALDMFAGTLGGGGSAASADAGGQPAHCGGRRPLCLLCVLQKDPATGAQSTPGIWSQAEGHSGALNTLPDCQEFSQCSAASPRCAQGCEVLNVLVNAVKETHELL